MYSPECPLYGAFNPQIADCIFIIISNVLSSVQYWVRFVSELVRTVRVLVIARLLASSLLSQYQLIVWGHKIRYINPFKKGMNRRKQVD